MPSDPLTAVACRHPSGGGRGRSAVLMLLLAGAAAGLGSVLGSCLTWYYLRRRRRPSGRPTWRRQRSASSTARSCEDESASPTHPAAEILDENGDDARAVLKRSVSLLRPMTKMKTTKWQAERSHPMHVMREAVVLVMVGLPARGKSYISNSVVRFCRLLAVPVKSFNAGSLRRNLGAAGGQGATADFFSAKNKEAKAHRELLALQCCDEMLEWIYSGQSDDDESCIAILDATNTTVERRQKVLERCRAKAAEAVRTHRNPPPLRVVFMESICDDPNILEGNYRMKMFNDDYKGAENKDNALEDFKKRVSAYVEQYQALEDWEVVAPSTQGDEDANVATGCVRITNGGQKLSFVATGCSLVMLNISVLLSCFHLTSRRIVLVPERGVGAENVAALLDRAEQEDEDGRPVDLICRASRYAVRLVRQVESILRSKSRPSSTGSNLSKEGLRQPRGILCLRKLEPIASWSEDVDMRPSAGGRHQASEELPEESFSDLVDRLKEVICVIERLPRSLIVMYPSEEVLRVLLAHFYGCPEDTTPSEMPLPEGPIIELRRDHKGFALHESALPAPSPTS
mmetsp:Transcript_125114/g.315119  ORF Transcript_125114/g.315119 Transcript_125114/m.315119 type:complete len:572 (-) Transcript_125114:41-1756(-)